MNTTRPHVRSALGWFISLLVIGFVGSLWAPTAQAADNTVVSTSPATDSSVDASPSEISITFAQLLGTPNQLAMSCGPDGNRAPVSLSTPAVLADGVTLQATLVSVAPKGTCTVSWSVLDANLQPAGSGSFNFTVANAPPATTVPSTTVAPPPGATIVPITDAAPTTQAVTTGTTGSSSSDSSSGSGTESGSKGPLGLFRLVSNLALAVLFGSLVLIAVAWPEGVEYILTVRFLRFTWMVALASTFLFVGAVAAQQSGDGLGSSILPTGWGDLLDTAPGKAAILRLLFTAVTAYVVMRPERSIDPSTQLPALVPPGLAVVTMAFSRDEFSLLENLTGIVHVLAMSVWIGGLVLLWRVVLAGPGEEDLVHAVRGYSRLSVPALLATVVAGIIQFAQLDRGHITASHGLVLLVKTLAVCVMMFIGLKARQFISQRVSRVDTMTAPLATRLRRALGVEALVGVFVLALTAWLLALTPPGLASGDGSGSLQLGSRHVFASAATGVEVDVAFSERVGANDVRIEVVTPATGLTGLTVDFIPPVGSFVNGMTINKIPLTGTGTAVLEKSDNFTLTATGTWTLIVSANGAEIARQDVFVGGSQAADTTTTTTATSST